MQKSHNQLVSIIVTTKNSAGTIEACLRSIRKQVYSHIELIVVDNKSTDSTKEIASKYTDLVFDFGPERSAQRNFGVEKATGSFVCIIDSDMELDTKVISECVECYEYNEATPRAVQGNTCDITHTPAGEITLGGIIIPEESFGVGFLAQVKRLERSFYIGEDSIEAPRFFEKVVYQEVSGYDEQMTGGEDWDLANRLRAQGYVFKRIGTFIYHNEGKLTLRDLFLKKKRYAREYWKYYSKRQTKNKERRGFSAQGPISRYVLFIRKARIGLKEPLQYISVFVVKGIEFLGGAIGALSALLAPKRVQEEVQIFGTNHSTDNSGHGKTVYTILNGITTEISGGDRHAILLNTFGRDVQGFESHIIAPKILTTIIKKDTEQRSVSSLRRETLLQRGLILFMKYILRTCISIYRVRSLVKAEIIKGQSVSLVASSHFFFDVVPLLCAQSDIKKAVFVHHIVSLQRKRGIARIYHVLFESTCLYAISLLQIKVIVVSRYIADALVAKYGFFRGNILVSSNGIDTVSLNLRSGVQDMLVPKAEGKRYDLLYCGRLHITKGIHDFLEIVHMVFGKNKNIRAVILGSGPEERFVTQEIVRLGLEKVIDIRGYVTETEKKEVFLESKVFVSPTYEEGWGIAIGEALAAGLDIVAYESEELRSVWGDALHWVPKGSIEIAGEAISYILESLSVKTGALASVEEKKRVEKAGVRNILLEKYNWNEVLKQETDFITADRLHENQNPVFVLGSYGRGNIGDDIFLYAARELYTDRRLVINTANIQLLPVDLRNTFETMPTSFLQGLCKKVLLFLQSDSVVYLGGNVWVCMPENLIKRQHLYKMILVNSVARLCRKKVFYIGVGAGHLDHFSIFLARISARLAHKVIYRDADSKSLLSMSGPKFSVLPDLATIVPSVVSIKEVPKKKQVAISFLYHIPNPDIAYVPTRDSLVNTIVGLIQKGYQVVFVPMFVSDEVGTDDLWVGRDIQREVHEKIAESEYSRYTIIEEQNLSAIEIIFAESEFVIAARLHANILSVLQGTPTIAISYRDKVKSFMREINLSSYTINLEDINKVNRVVSYILDSYIEVQSQVESARRILIEHGKQYRNIRTIEGERVIQESMHVSR